MYPERIVCLAAEIPAILYELGALDRVVGISAYTTRPPEALNIPKVSGFQNGSIKRILDTKPDVAILTSAVQNGLAAELGKAGVTVIHLYPQRLQDLFSTITLLGNIVGAPDRASALNERLETAIDAVRGEAKRLPRRPRVYFEEWMDPLITGIGWVSDVIELAGGEDVFRTKATGGLSASERVIQPEEVIAADPEIVFASWCGKPFRHEEFYARPGFSQISAVHNHRVYEWSGEILQCGPMLVDTLESLHQVIAKVARSEH
ncbi:cobalamin-binding protein [Alicyclobacillus hesperidum subsp. aegles]|uniref:ABC transporter substrate-binding protein n=1 Tax=Alicyclobacillus hesperidum TaxID=89784 RepID=UPI00222CA2FC|nr:ABC transporter substrate-binding protein [Alicyclobacillus hesperidum]GLG01408.1 cobalamin-binding protein [Alicyclobacillus hesperidum subsp. aegles]